MPGGRDAHGRRWRWRWWHHARGLGGERERSGQRQNLDDRVTAFALHSAGVAAARPFEQAQLTANAHPGAGETHAQMNGVLARDGAARAAHAGQETGIERVGAGATGGRVKVDADRNALGRGGRALRQRQQREQPDGEARDQAPPT